MKKAIYFFGLLLVAVGFTTVAVPSAVSAQSKNTLVQDAACADTPDDPKCLQKKPDDALNRDCRTSGETCNPVTQFVNPLINTLAAAAGIAVVIGIIVGGIQYASSGGDPQKAAAGKSHIRTSIIALIAFFFLYSFLQFVIPGGILTR